MEKITEFRIPIVSLKNKVHHFEYKIDGKFFKEFNNEAINDCMIEVKVSLEKRDSLIVMLFYVDGIVKLTCDRCLDIYSQDVFGDYKLIYQFGGDINQDNDNDDDIILLPKNSDYINIAKPMYDYILLSIPIQHIHPNISDCNQKMIEFLNNSKKKKDEIDPRWEILNKLKNK